VFWGEHMVKKNHLSLVLEKFNKDQQGLLEEDINVKDKQNFPTIQRIAFPKVRKCLEAIDEGLVYEGMYFQEHVKSTIFHLQVIWAFWEVFNGQGTLLEQMELSSFVVDMICFGIEYICNVQHGHNLQDNWLIKKSIIDCLIFCHSAILHIMVMRDLFPNLPIALHKNGLDCCEDFFFLFGQHVKNKPNFCIGRELGKLHT